MGLCYDSNIANGNMNCNSQWQHVRFQAGSAEPQRNRPVMRDRIPARS